MGLPTLTSTEKPSVSETRPEEPSAVERAAATISDTSGASSGSSAGQQSKSDVERAAEKAYEERIEDEYAKREGGA
jgi:hypothetical protein